MPFPPSVVDFKDFFVREFPYGDGQDFVRDADIVRGINEATIQFNPSLFDTSTVVGIGNLSEGSIALLYLAAHIMVLNVQGAGGLSAEPRGRGIRNVGEGVVVSKGIGQANVSYQIPPPNVSESPILLYFFRTDFGQRYMQILMPRLIGNVAVVSGRSPWEGSGLFNNPPLPIDPGAL